MYKPRVRGLHWVYTEGYEEVEGCKLALVVRPDGLEPPIPRSVDTPSVPETESDQG